MNKRPLNHIDLKIINMLKENARTPNTEIAKRLGMVPSAILERIRKLEKRGVIQGYRVQVNPVNLGYNLLAFVMIRCSVPNWSDVLLENLLKIDCIEEIHEVMGEYSYMLKLRARDKDHMSEILKDQIGNIPEISNTNGTMVLKTIKTNY